MKLGLAAVLITMVARMVREVSESGLCQWGVAPELAITAAVKVTDCPWWDGLRKTKSGGLRVFPLTA